MNIQIRRESAQDAAAIEAVTIAAFQDAPHTSHTEHFIVNALRKAGKLTVSLVAEAEGEIVGHVAVSPVTISDGSKNWYGLGPISVIPTYQGKEVGSKLMNEALNILRALGAAGCVVLGEPAYYGRFGFRVEPAVVLSGVPPQYFQIISFDQTIPQGNVSYDAAFDAQQ